MAGAVACCGAAGGAAGATPPGGEDICAKLAREIDEMVNRDKHKEGGGGTHGLKHRFREQVAPGAQGPGTDSWRRHEQAIRDQQSGLRDRLNKYRDNGCGPKNPIPADAWKWASKPVPTAKEWEANNKRVVVEEPGVFDLKYWETVTGLTGAALIIYLIVSEGSRLFPPRNAIPVP